MSLLLLLLACGPSSDDIVRNLQSPNPVVREDSAKIARNVTTSPEMILALIGILNDPSPRAQQNAIETLVDLQAVEAVPHLCALLENQELSISIQHSVIDALGRLRSPNAVPSLVQYLENDMSNPALDAIWALGYIGDMSALDVLSELRMHSDPYVVHNATVALRELRP